MDRDVGKPPRLKKRLGQHLLRSSSAAGRIVEALEARPGELVLEIGPGLGALTARLLERGIRVLAVEKDRELADELERRLAVSGEGELPGRLRVVRGDILEVSLEAVCGSEGIPRVRVIGNIPYGITSPILHWLSAQARWVAASVLTIQREVADRLLAAPGNKAYGSLTLAVARRFGVERVMQLPAAAFKPPPKVASSVVRLAPHDRPVVEVRDEELLEAVIRRSFQERRKMLRSSLGPGSPWGASGLAAAAERAGIAVTRRPEELSLAEFGRLSGALWDLGYGRHQVRSA